MRQKALFVTDLHGSQQRCRKLWRLISEQEPQLVFWGGDILPNAFHDLLQTETESGDFIESFLVPELEKLKAAMKRSFPRIFIIAGNDDPLTYEDSLIQTETTGLWTYSHNRIIAHGDLTVIGYSFVPPTPFQLKDWEKYDVSRYSDPGCVSPEEGFRSMKTDQNPRYETIERDLTELTGKDDLSNAIILFHSPPYQTMLDRAALDGKFIDHVPLNPHIGSIAIRRFVEQKQPLLTLHGHVHESTRLTGTWRDKIGRTEMFNAAHDGPELSVILFDPENPHDATRTLL